MCGNLVRGLLAMLWALSAKRQFGVVGAASSLRQRERRPALPTGALKVARADEARLSSGSHKAGRRLPLLSELPALGASRVERSGSSSASRRSPASRGGASSTVAVRFSARCSTWRRSSRRSELGDPGLQRRPTRFRQSEEAGARCVHATAARHPERNGEVRHPPEGSTAVAHA